LDSGLVVAARGHIQAHRLAAAEDHAVGDPAGSAAGADDILYDLDRLVNVPVVGKPVPVSIALTSVASVVVLLG
jgi:hypothetical protein